MKKLIIILAAFFLVFTSCDTTDPKPPEEKPPGYQEDIHWPSLADSPWPMAHHDPQSTGRSKFKGPVLGQKLWTFGDNNGFYGGIIVGPDSSIHAIAQDTLGVVLYNISSQGNIKSINQLTPSGIKNFTAPLIRQDGSIVYFDGMKTISAINFDGESIWEYSGLGYFNSRNKSISIDKDGNLYFTCDQNKLIVLTPDGKPNWELTDTRIGCNFSLYVVTFAPDGKTAYIPGCGVTVVAVDVETKQIKWTFGETTSQTSILVDSEGNIYFEKKIISTYTQATFVSLKSDGTLRWEYTNPFATGGESTPTIDKYGNLYFGSDSLYSVDYFGKLRWKIGLDGFCDAPIICDEFGDIYVTTVPNESEKIKLYSISSEGNVNWVYTANGITGTNGSAAIGYNNTIFVPVIYDGKILTVN